MNLQVGVKVLLKNEKNEYLFLRRSEVMEHGGERVWDIPGGRIEPTETLFDALTREVKEETGMTLERDVLLCGAQDIMVTEKDLHVVRLTYKSTANGEITLSDEHDEYMWCEINNLRSIGDTIDPYLRSLISTGAV